MRWTFALLALVAVGCRTRLQTARESDFYGGVGLSALPDVGGSVTAGQIGRTTDRFDFAFEMRASYQGGDDSPTQDGEFFHIQAGVKQTASPGHPRRLFFRYGMTWFRANGDPRILDQRGDYLGVYGGVGYEWDLSEHWTLSPDVTANVVNGEGSTGTDFLPQLALSLLFRF
jgi:hypothetical protein